MLHLNSIALVILASCWSMTMSAQTVKTDPRFARGATKAFGRMTVTGIPSTDIAEQGFCWSESPEPTIEDFKTTKFLSNNGRIYCLEELTPATKYFMRAYVLKKKPGSIVWRCNPFLHHPKRSDLIPYTHKQR